MIVFPVIVKPQESIQIGCVLSACKPYVLHRPAPDVGGAGCPQVNKFEQVSSDGHQVSLARGVLDLMSRGEEGWGLGRGTGLYSEVQCIMGNDHRGSPLWTDRMTGTHD